MKHIESYFKLQVAGHQVYLVHLQKNLQREMAFQNSQLCTNLFRTWHPKVILSKI